MWSSVVYRAGQVLCFAGETLVALADRPPPSATTEPQIVFQLNVIAEGAVDKALAAKRLSARTVYGRPGMPM